MSRLAYYEHLVQDEEAWLRFMVDRNHRDDEAIAMCVQQAKDAVWLYEQDDNPAHLTAAEAFSELAANLKEHKYTIANIREQREKVQWAKAQLKTEQQSAEHSQSSDNSKT